jgi:hypothetical protein
MALAAAALAAPGCSQFAWLLYHTVGPFVPEDQVAAEFDLKNRSVLILVDSRDPMMSTDFPRVEVRLAEELGKFLQSKQAVGPLVPAHSVEAARRANTDFGEWSIAQVGQYFNVDVVVHIELFEFRLKDAPGSNVYRGYAEAAARAVNPQTGEQAWPVLSAARLVKAEALPDASTDEPAAQETILVEGFAEKLGRLFITYKPAELPIRPKVK